MISEQLCPTFVGIVNIRMKSMKVSLSRSVVSFQINMLMKMEYEPPHEKTNNLHMQKKQRRRSASQRLCFRYMDTTIPLLKSKISSFCDCDCTSRFVSGLVGTQIVGFLTHRFIY